MNASAATGSNIQMSRDSMSQTSTSNDTVCEFWNTSTATATIAMAATMRRTGKLALRLTLSSHKLILHSGMMATDEGGGHCLAVKACCKNLAEALPAS